MTLADNNGLNDEDMKLPVKPKTTFSKEIVIPLEVLEEIGRNPGSIQESEFNQFTS
ncbi:MAG: hypothetical protein ACE5D7_05075 [Fidelibacterota bacterium]